MDVETSPDAWTVHDTECWRWNMPLRAVSINMGYLAARKVAQTLNTEWAAFERNPF